MDFVSNVSHEFKTPINAIEGYTMLLQGEELSPDQEESVEKILFNTQRLSGLVGNILLLSKLENQNIPMKMCIRDRCCTDPSPFYRTGRYFLCRDCSMERSHCDLMHQLLCTDA